MKGVLTGTAVILVLAAVVQAQAPLTGKWEEAAASGLQIELDLTTIKTTLTGTFTVRGRPMTITDGTVSKNTFTFKATLEDQPEGFTGELVGDRITLWRDRNNRADAVVLKRAGQTGLTGKWRGETGNGSQIVLDLKATETALTGTLTRDGQPTTIADGKVSKNAFTFKATLNDQMEEITGEVDGDQITAWLDRQGRERAVVLKRVRR